MNLSSMSTETLEDALNVYLGRIGKSWKYGPEEIARFRTRIDEIETELANREKED